MVPFKQGRRFTQDVFIWYGKSLVVNQRHKMDVIGVTFPLAMHNISMNHKSQCYVCSRLSRYRSCRTLLVPVGTRYARQRNISGCHMPYVICINGRGTMNVFVNSELWTAWMRDLIVRYSLLANVLRLHASYVSYLELEWCRTEIYVFSYICINKLYMKKPKS